MPSEACERYLALSRSSWPNAFTTRRDVILLNYAQGGTLDPLDFPIAWPQAAAICSDAEQQHGCDSESDDTQLPIKHENHQKHRTRCDESNGDWD